MSFANKTDYIGLARSGLEVVANSQNASNQTLDVVSANGDYVVTESFGSVSAPHVDYKITGSVSFATTKKLVLGKVFGTGTKPYALRSFQIHTGAGEEPTFGADAVEIESGATKTLCTYDVDSISITPARHAQTFGAVTYTESSSLALQSGDLTGEVEISPVTINGVPKASDAVRGRLTASFTFWSTSDSTVPSVTAATGWTKTADWSCTGADGQLFSWTVTFVKNLAKSST